MKVFLYNSYPMKLAFKPIKPVMKHFIREEEREVHPLIINAKFSNKVKAQMKILQAF